MTTYCITFSPCDSTQEIANMIARQLPQPVESVDLTRRDTVLPSFSAEDVLVVACPVYGGRIPTPAAERLSVLQGNGARAIAVVVFGNRAYEDALLETVDILTACHVTTIAGGAFVARHSLMPSIAANRPDAQDTDEIVGFARRAADLIAAGTRETVSVPGNRPYRTFAGMPASPVVNAACCIRCGLCAAVCPVGAIDSKDPTQTNAEECLLCMRCVEVCQAQGRSLPKKVQEAIEAKLAPLANVRAANETFFA